MWPLVVCALFVTAAAYPQRNYGDISQYLRLSSPRRDSFLNDVQKAEAELQKRCEMYGGEDAYGNFMTVVQSSAMEVRSALFVEMQIAENNGESPSVGFYCRMQQSSVAEEFGKGSNTTGADSCEKRLSPTFKKVFENIMNAGKNCISPIKRSEISEVINITGSTLDYICYSEGERITSFVESGGVQCLTKIQDNLIDCMNESIGSNLFSLEEPMNEEDNKINREQECRLVFQLESCVKQQILECQNPTATSFVEGVLDAIISPSCKKHEKYPLNIVQEIPFALG